MPRLYRARNKRIIARAGNGRFRKTTAADFGIGVCPVCNHFMIQVYDGDENEDFLDPRKFRYRCFTCEPKTEAELAKERAALEAAKGQKSGLERMLEEAAATIINEKKLK